MKPEQKFYQWFRDAMPTDSDIARIETSTDAGVPDTNVHYKDQDVWVELKCYEGGKVLLRPAQWAWGHRRSFHGGRVFVLAKHPVGEVHLWQFPMVMHGNHHITSIPHGKYLMLTSMPVIINAKEQLLNCLFTH